MLFLLHMSLLIICLLNTSKNGEREKKKEKLIFGRRFCEPFCPQALFAVGKSSIICKPKQSSISSFAILFDLADLLFTIVLCNRTLFSSF